MLFADGVFDPKLGERGGDTCHVVGAFGPKLDGVVFGEE